MRAVPASARTGGVETMSLGKRCAAEGFGTFWLVFGGCGSAVLAAAFPEGGYSLVSSAVAEITLTFFFLFVICGATDKRAPAGFAPIAIGLCLTLIHLVGIPVTNLSVNPARSTGPAVFVGGWALAQLWLFWVAPIVGGALGGVVYNLVASED